MNSSRDGVAEREQDQRRTAPPIATDQPIMRIAAARAPSASDAPSIRPIITCPAIAIASSTSARNTHSWNAIWCAPSDAAPIRASTAEPIRNEPVSAVVRTAISDPIRISGRIFSGMRALEAGAVLDGEERRPPSPTCAITVPHAEPVRPQPKP